MKTNRFPEDCLGQEDLHHVQISWDEPQAATSMIFVPINWF